MDTYRLIDIFKDTADQYSKDPVLISAVAETKRNSVFHPADDYPKLDKASYDGTTTVSVTRHKSFEAVKELRKTYGDARICVLNFASSFNPGGGVKRGCTAQEESLCRCSTLYPALDRRYFWQKYYSVNRDRSDCRNTDDVIYTPDIVVFKTDDAYPVMMDKNDWLKTDVITCAAPDLRWGSMYNSGFTQDSEEISAEAVLLLHLQRAKHILHIAAHHKADVLVLGAFGCGAFENPPEIVAEAYREALQEYSGYFRHIEFAVYCTKYETENYEVFKRVFVENKPAQSGSRISIKKVSIINAGTECIVNAANNALQGGSGVCGAIFRAAGWDELQEACDMIGHCDTGKAVITPAFDLKAKYIIHTVGPVWGGGHQQEPQLLYSCYQESLKLAQEHGCHSIAFPLISAGIFGYPVEGAWKQALTSCRDYLREHPEADMNVVFTVLDDRILECGEKLLNSEEEESDDPDTEDAYDSLMIAGQKKKAVFFHLPGEPDGYLSNWYLSPFDLDGIHFTSCEQYIMYHKCALFHDVSSAEQVLRTDDPAEQQKIGRKASGYNAAVWEGMRQALAVRGLMAKFTQNEMLKEQLLDTGDAYLVECAGSDHIWACGRRLDDPRRKDADSWDGKNILGFALMQVRQMLKEQK